MNNRTLLIAGAALAAAAGLLAGPGREAALRDERLQHWVIDHGFARAMASGDHMTDLVNASELRVILCGTGSPLPNAHRAGPCSAVVAGGKIWLVDAGGGGWRNLMLWQLPVNQLAGVLLTHFHSDHIEDLGEVNLQSWGAGRPAALPVYGGPGIEGVVNGFLQAYSADTGYRVAHHGPSVMPPDHELMLPKVIETAPGIALREGQTQLVLDQDGLKITAIGVNHGPVVPAYAYRFDYGGRSITLSGDTKYSPPLATAAQGTDILVHEAQSDTAVQQFSELFAARGNWRLAHIFRDIQTYHTTPEQAAQIANMAGAKLLVLNHLTPAVPMFLGEPLFMGPVEKIRPSGSVLGQDGLMVSLPAHSDAVETQILQTYQ